MMGDFQFTNEQIIYLHTHFEDYLKTLEVDLQKQNAYVSGQIELLEKTYGETPDFDHETHNLYKRLMVEEMPQMLKEKAKFIRNLGNKFTEIYEMLEEADPNYVQEIKDELFEQPQHIKDLVELLNQKENGSKN